MAAPDIRYYLLHNNNQADTIFPMVFDQSGTVVIWDGSKDPGNAVGPGSQRLWDLNDVKPEIKSQTVVTFGIKVRDSGKIAQDPSKRTYINSSQNTADGYYLQDGTFVLDPPQVARLDAATFQDAYLKLNNPAVAKLLVAVASLISPEIAEIA